MAVTVAHRGASGHALENTMQAFRKAVEFGADIIECDVRITKDGNIVVIHDADLKRTTHAEGLVREFTLEELRKIKTLNCENVPLLKMC